MNETTFMRKKPETGGEESVERMLRGDPRIRNVQVKREGGITFEKYIHTSQEGIMHVRYEVHLYPDIHKMTALAQPLPPIRIDSAVSRWYLKEQNLLYQKNQGITVQYHLNEPNLALAGQTELKRNPRQDLQHLLKVMDRALAEDYPKMLDIYFGVIPRSVRQDLTGQMDAYRRELEEAD